MVNGMKKGNDKFLSNFYERGYIGQNDLEVKKMTKTSTKLYQLFNVLMFAGVIVVNALANILPINNQTTGALSDKYPNLFTPAAITFAVWGVIYALLALFILYQSGVFTAKSKTHIASVRRIGPWFIISSIGNMAWIFLWHYMRVGLSLVAMLVILVSLIVIQLKINKPGISAGERWFSQIPFSVYFGWITVATVANVTAALVNAGWGRFGLSEPLWTTIMIGIAAVIALAHILTRKDIAFGAVIVWAFAGIFIKHMTTFNAAYPGVLWTLGVAAGLVILAVIVSAVRLGSKKQIQ